MAVKKIVGSAALDPTNPKQAPLVAEEAQGHVHNLSSLGVVVACDITSTLKFGSIPSNARLLIQSRLDNDAIAGNTVFDLGIGKTVAGVYTAQNDACLMSAVDLHLAGNVNALSAVALANLGKAAWEIAGYATDPGGNLDIMGTFDAAPTAGGNIFLTLLFSTP